MFCSNCGKEATGKFCSNCGAPLNGTTVSEQNENINDFITQINGENVNITELMRIEQAALPKSKGTDINRIDAATAVKKRLMNDYGLKSSESKKILRAAVWDRLPQPSLNADNVARCPRCGSTSLSANKKGFGIGKTVIGATAAGPIGLIAGNIGSHKIKVTCLKCGHQFWK